MKLLLDADGCPVVDIAIQFARKASIPCLILCDTAHVFQKEGAVTITVSKGADSVDFALVNKINPGDVVVTQDYGLAAMCLAKKARVLSQNGLEYTAENIEGLLSARHTARKVRMAGGRIKGSPKRTSQQDEDFKHALEKILASALFQA